MSAIYREADLSAEETELQELQSQQQMALAVHHVLETMLPAAACAVEQAACELSRQLMELSSLAASQQELLKQALALSGGQGELEDSISEISCDAALIHDQTNQIIRTMVFSLQFQDRNSQLMQNAVHLLKQCTPKVPDHLAQPSMAARLSSIALARSIIAKINIYEVRQLMIEAMENFRIMPKKTKSNGSGEGDQVELF